MRARLLWLWCEMSHVGTCICTTGPQLMALFGQVLEPLGGGSTGKKWVSGGWELTAMTHPCILPKLPWFLVSSM